MAFNIGDVLGQDKPLSIDYGGGHVLHFTYRPNAYTPDLEEQVEQVRGNVIGRTFTTNLLPLISWWDVVVTRPQLDETGQPATDESGRPVMVDVPVPIDQAGMYGVPLGVLADIMRAINQDVLANPTRSTRSEGSFS